MSSVRFWIRGFAALSLALALGACGNALQQRINKATGGLLAKPGEVEINAFDFAKFEGNPTEVADDFVDDTHVSAFEKETRVVVPTVRFFFNTRRGAAASAQGRTTQAGYNTSVKVTMNLAGVQPEMLQQIADEAWVDVKKQIEGMGLTIVDPAEYKSNEHWQKLLSQSKTEKKPIDMWGGEYILVTPTGMPAYTYAGEEGALSAFGAFNLSGRADILEQKLAKDMNKAFVLTPTFVIDFSKCYAAGGMWSNEAAASCVPSVQLLPNNSKLAFSSTEKMDSFFTAQKATGWLILSDPIETNDDFGTVGQIDQSEFELYIPYHSYSGSSSKVFAVKANPEQFKQVALKVVKTGTTLFFAKAKEELN